MNILTHLRKALNEIDQRHRIRLADSVSSGTVGKHVLRELAKQVYLQEKYPSHIAYVYLSLEENQLEDSRVVRYILSILEAENLGKGSNGATHSKLARHFAYSVGVTAEELAFATPTPANKALMDWCDMSAIERHWLDALAVQLACESQVESMQKIAVGLKTHYHLSENDIQFWFVHGGPVEEQHRSEGLSLLRQNVTTENLNSVIYSYEMTCRFNQEFFDSLIGG